MKLIYFLFILLFSNSYSQTCIVIARTPQVICIGMDSRRGGTDINGNIRYFTTCKIKKVNNVYITISGANSDKVYETAIACCKKNTTLKGTVEIFSKIERVKRREYLELLKNGNDATYNRHFDEFKQLQVSFFGYENNIPKIISTEFILTSNKSEPIVLMDTTSYFTEKIDNGNTDFVLMGHTDYIVNLSVNEKFWSKRTLEVGIEDLIKVECTKEPLDVGEPINILLIRQGKDNYKWLKNPIKCDF